LVVSWSVAGGGAGGGLLSFVWETGHAALRGSGSVHDTYAYYAGSMPVVEDSFPSWLPAAGDGRHIAEGGMEPLVIAEVGEERREDVR